MQEALEQLESGARERMLDAFMPKSKGNVRSAAKKFAFFMHTYPTLGLFRRATPFDPDATAHNEWILILFAHWLCSVPSRKTGRPLKGASIASYVSTVKGLMSHVYKFDITHDPQRLRRVVKDIRDKDPLAMRKKRRGLRRRHLRKIIKKLPRVAAFLRGTAAPASDEELNELNEFAAVSCAWHNLARGGELTRAKGRGGPSRADLTFGSTRSGAYSCFMLRPLKKRSQAAQAKVPQLMQAHDGGGSDTHAAMYALDTLDPVADEDRSVTAVFRIRKRGVTRPMTVAQFRATVKRYARLLRQTDLAAWGAHSPRIGGTTDLAATGKGGEVGSALAWITAHRMSADVHGA